MIDEDFQYISRVGDFVRRDIIMNGFATHGVVRYGYDSEYQMSIPTSLLTSLSTTCNVARSITSAKISDVKILSPNKVVQVVFADGTREKAVCSENDTFSLETGITVCIAKKLLGGTKEYNKAIRNAVKIMERNEKERKEREERNKRIALKHQKEAEKRRERKIKIQEEAYYRAMKRVETEKKE